MQTQATLTTFKCNACHTEQTIAGATPIADARDSGWEVDAEILSYTVDLCVDCAKELKVFLRIDVSNEPAQLIDVAAGGDWAGVPTPAKGESFQAIPQEDVIGVGMDLTEGGTR